MRADLPAALGRLRDDLDTIRLDLVVPGAEEARRTKDDLVAQVDDYLLPRLGRMDAPALIVVGGSTGAGKSTLLNSLVGSVVSPAGVLRPTTRAPVLAFHPDDLGWFEGERVLPGLPRASGGRRGRGRCSSRRRIRFLRDSPSSTRPTSTPSLPRTSALVDGGLPVRPVVFAVEDFLEGRCGERGELSSRERPSGSFGIVVPRVASTTIVSGSPSLGASSEAREAGRVRRRARRPA